MEDQIHVLFWRIRMIIGLWKHTQIPLSQCHPGPRHCTVAGHAVLTIGRQAGRGLVIHLIDGKWRLKEVSQRVQVTQLVL